MPRMLRKLVIGSACGIVLTISTGLTAGATTQSPTTGQPGAPTNTCGSQGATMTPGGSASATGSPFNANGQAGAVYAGNPDTASLANSHSSAAVSQYDIACFKVTR